MSFCLLWIIFKISFSYLFQLSFTDYFIFRKWLLIISILLQNLLCFNFQRNVFNSRFINKTLIWLILNLLPFSILIPLILIQNLLDIIRHRQWLHLLNHRHYLLISVLISHILCSYHQYIYLLIVSNWHMLMELRLFLVMHILTLIVIQITCIMITFTITVSWHTIIYVLKFLTEI